MSEPNTERVPNVPGLIYRVLVDDVLIGRIKREAANKPGRGRVAVWSAWEEGGEQRVSRDHADVEAATQVLVDWHNAKAQQ